MAVKASSLSPMMNLRAPFFSASFNCHEILTVEGFLKVDQEIIKYRKNRQMKIFKFHASHLFWSQNGWTCSTKI